MKDPLAQVHYWNCRENMRQRCVLKIKGEAWTSG